MTRSGCAIVGDVRDGAFVPHQQMRTTVPVNYPFDRYLVEGSKDLDAFLQEENWHTEPMLRPEEELLLKKLQDMLQSTTDDLKLLSGELTKYRDAYPKIKIPPTPLDEEFNEKVRIEEAVDAKFYGYKIIEKPVILFSKDKINDALHEKEKATPKLINKGVQASVDKNNPILKRKKVNKTNIEAPSNEEQNKLSMKKDAIEEKILYKEVHFEYIDPHISKTPTKLHVQEMPSINIRSAFTEQKVIQLDIQPQIDILTEKHNNNIIVIDAKHNFYQPNLSDKSEIDTATVNPNIITSKCKKITMMSSESTSDPSITSLKHTRNILHHNENKPSNTAIETKTTTKRIDNIGHWRKRLHRVYNKATPKIRSTIKYKDLDKYITNKHEEPNTTHNIEYIPYSKLTLGGVNVHDIEKEMVNTNHKNNNTLSPILHKLLSREDSKIAGINKKHTSEILTNSDENLLQEIINIEKTVTNTLCEHFENNNLIKNNIEENLSYEDDFENSYNLKNTNSSYSTEKSLNKHSMQEDEEVFHKEPACNSSAEVEIKTTLNKTINLSMKNKVDVFEYVPPIDRQEAATQSIEYLPQKYPKETQTLHTESQSNILNKLCSTSDIQKKYTQKIITEYTDLIEKKQFKPGTSNCLFKKNAESISVISKNTQTFPARVCSKTVMTSPTEIRTRTPQIETSINCDLNTSRESNIKLLDDISPINLSSTKFNLRIPENSKEVATNCNRNFKTKLNSTSPEYSCSSVDVESCNSSDFSSLGEIKFKLQRKTNTLTTTSESSNGSSVSSSKSNSRITLDISKVRSEGEASCNIIGKSEGELRLRRHLKSEGEA